MDFFEDINTNKVKTDYITNKPTGSNSVKNGFWFDPLSKTIMVSKNLDSDEPTWCEVATKCDIPLRFDITHHYYSTSKYNYVFVYNYTKTYRYGYPYIYTYTYRYNYDWFFFFYYKYNYNYYYDIFVHTYHRYEYKYEYPYSYTYTYTYRDPVVYEYRYPYSYTYTYTDTVFVPVVYEYPYSYTYSYIDTVFVPVFYEYPYSYSYYTYGYTVFVPVFYEYEYEYPYSYPYYYPYEYVVPYFYNLSKCYCETSEITEDLHIPFTQEVEVEYQTLEREGTVMDHILTDVKLTADHLDGIFSDSEVIVPVADVLCDRGGNLVGGTLSLSKTNHILEQVLSRFITESRTYTIEYKTENGDYICNATPINRNRSLANNTKVFSENSDGSFGYYDNLLDGSSDNLISITEPSLLSDNKSSNSGDTPRVYSLSEGSARYYSEIEYGSEEFDHNLSEEGSCECSCSVEFIGTKTNHNLTITAYGYGQVGFAIKDVRVIEYYGPNGDYSTNTTTFSEEINLTELGSSSGISSDGTLWRSWHLPPVPVNPEPIRNVFDGYYAKFEPSAVIPPEGLSVQVKVPYSVDKYSTVDKTVSTTINGIVHYTHKYTTQECSCIELSPSEVIAQSNVENTLVAFKPKNFEPYPHKIVYTPVDRESSHYSFLILAESKGLVVKQLNDSYYQVNNLKVTVVSGQWSGDGMQIPSAKTGTVFDVKGFSKIIPFYKDLYAVVKPTLKYGKVISVSDVELVDVEQLKSMIFNTPAFKIVGKLEINDSTKECLPVQYTTSNLIYPFNFGIEIPFCLNQKTKDSNDDFATFEALGGILQVVDKDNKQIGSFDIGDFEIDLTEEQLNAGGYVCLKVKFKLIDGKPTKLKSYKVKFHSSESSIAKNIDSGNSLASKTEDTFTDIIPLSKVLKNSVTPVLIKGFEHLNSGRLILQLN